MSARNGSRPVPHGNLVLIDCNEEDSNKRFHYGKVFAYGTSCIGKVITGELVLIDTRDAHKIQWDQRPYFLLQVDHILIGTTERREP